MARAGLDFTLGAVKEGNTVSTDSVERNLPYIWVRRLDAVADQRMRQEGNSGRRVVALRMMPEYSVPLTSCRWQPPLKGAKSSIFESGSQCFEVSTFNQFTTQDRHYHKEATEIYIVLEGQMSILVEGDIIALDQGDEIIILPGTWHHVLGGNRFLARVHTINCHGDCDKYTEESV